MRPGGNAVWIRRSGCLLGSIGFIVAYGAEQQRLCAVGVIGMNAQGEKHFLAIEYGVRESTQSWREVLLKLKARLLRAPMWAIGDGAMRFWALVE